MFQFKAESHFLSVPRPTSKVSKFLWKLLLRWQLQVHGAVEQTSLSYTNTINRTYRYRIEMVTIVKSKSMSPKIIMECIESPLWGFIVLSKDFMLCRNNWRVNAIDTNDRTWYHWHRANTKRITAQQCWLWNQVVSCNAFVKPERLVCLFVLCHNSCY